MLSLNMKNYPLVWIVIGVSGSGKTTIGRRLSQYLECDFIEGDRRHPPANIHKMYSQIPLNDEDRSLWLQAIDRDIQRSIAGKQEVVMTCSALKKSYRQQLISKGRVQLILPEVSIAVLEQRLTTRADHYMQSAMLASQIAAFEPIDADDSTIAVDGNLPIDDVVAELTTKIISKFPDLKIPWWQRKA
jgi:gluconokinase